MPNPDPLKNYSLSRAIKCLLERKNDGLEGALNEELQSKYSFYSQLWNTGQKPPNVEGEKVGFLVPIKALTATTATTGGFTIGDTALTIADALRPASVALSAGANMIEVRPDQRIPQIASGATAYWLAETEACPESSLDLADLKLSPHRCAAWLSVSNQLIKQAPAVADRVFARDLRAAIGSALDLGIFSGVGGEEPLGLLNNSNVPTVTFGGAPTRAKLCDFELSLGNNNANDLAASFVTSPASRKKWETTLNDAVAGAGYLWDSGRVLGRPARASNNVADNRAILGDFNDLLIVTWGVIEISDIYTAKKTAQTELCVQILADAATLHSASFAVSTDSAAQ
jgi:HK97 family phage major capsid protein